jgi:hypothetical protein
MEYGAIDLHMKKSQTRIVEADGTVVWKGHIDTRREAFEKVFRDRPRMQILLESSPRANGSHRPSRHRDLFRFRSLETFPGFAFL